MGLKLELRAKPGFHFFRGHHLDGVPWAAIQKTSVGAFAGTLLAADTELRINLDATEGRVLLVNHPIHAIQNRAVRNAGRGTGATGATLGDNGYFLGLFLARGVNAFGLRRELDNFTDRNVKLGHAGSPSPPTHTYCPKFGVTESTIMPLGLS
jgi:hypothetical protein